MPLLLCYVPSGVRGPWLGALGDPGVCVCVSWQAVAQQVGPRLHTRHPSDRPGTAADEHGGEAVARLRAIADGSDKSKRTGTQYMLAIASHRM